MGIAITFDTDNAAFDDGNGPAETARILRNIAQRIEFSGATYGTAHDINGNKVGEWSLTFEGADD